MYNGCANPETGQWVGTGPWCPTGLTDGKYISGGDGLWGYCDCEFTDVGGMMLHFNEAPAQYEEAVETCASVGSRLVEIRDVGSFEQVHRTIWYPHTLHSIELLTFPPLQIVEWLSDKNLGGDWAWIGLSDRVSEGNWVWETGGQVPSDVAAKAHWNQGGGEPNGQTDENCAAMSGTWGRFDDRWCQGTRSFVCEQIYDQAKYTCHMDQKWQAAPQRKYSEHSCYCKKIPPLTFKVRNVC